MIQRIFTSLAVALCLTGCSALNYTRIDYSNVDPRRGQAPQSWALLQRQQANNVDTRSPMLLRIFKQTHELELWRQDRSGTYVLINTFEICHFSGALGPKKRTGDMQAPEGFYTVTPAQMNYASREFLSFNTGFPNQFDRAHGRTGSALMVHGGCRSAGCYAIKDAPMQDLFAAMRDAFAGGQREIQLHIFPFRMDVMNTAINTGTANQAFWDQLRPGYVQFERTHRELRVSVVNGRYLVD